VIYAGGGTSQQLALHVKDDVESMTRYISRECNGAVDESTVRLFCEQSASNLRWLETRGGVSFQANPDGSPVVFLRKTSYPPSNVTLYNSGNESSQPWCDEAAAAPRGHRVAGEHLTGHALFEALHRAVSADTRISVRSHVVARALHLADGGKGSGAAKAVVALSVSALALDDELAALHDMLNQIGSGAPYIDPSGDLDVVRRLSPFTLRCCKVSRSVPVPHCDCCDTNKAARRRPFTLWPTSDASDAILATANETEAVP